MGQEEKKKNQVVIDFLVDEKGYLPSSAEKVVEEVLGAQKTLRIRYLEAFKTKRVRFECGGLQIEGFVHDVKVVDGTVSFHVKPIAGEGTIWVTHVLLI